MIPLALQVGSHQWSGWCQGRLSAPFRSRLTVPKQSQWLAENGDLGLFELHPITYLTNNY